MKIRKIIDICKKRGSILLFESEQEQWISDGSAVYPMFNLPKFDEKSLYKTYDITDKQAEKIMFRHEMSLPSSIDFSDAPPDEIPVERGPVCITEAGRSLVPYETSQGIVFIDARYLLPFTDVDDELIELYERQSTEGQMYFAVKAGFMLVGIIMPFDAINEDFVNRLKTLADQCDVALFNKRSANRRKEREESDKQSTLFDETEETKV